jgi:ferredoxin-thioredoxin reductase catalytic subunit
MKIILNPDKDIIAIAKEQLKEAKGHCPCVLPPFRNADTKCMCKTFREQVKQGIPGGCYCGVYIAVDETQQND